MGLIKSTAPVKIILRPNALLPCRPQYRTSPAAVRGIAPTIKGLVDAGVLYPTTSPCNTPILPIPKAHSTDYRLVHDLRAVNASQAETPVVPDPHILLSNIPPDTTYYTVVDLCSAFFSLPLHEDSQHLFAFTYEGQQNTYTRMPQGYCESPSVFNRLLRDYLAHLDMTSTVLQYVDDLLMCSPDKDMCSRLSPYSRRWRRAATRRARLSYSLCSKRLSTWEDVCKARNVTLHAHS